MTPPRAFPQRLKLQHLLFFLLLLSGIIPLAIISSLLISQNRDLIKTQEKSHLTSSARTLSVQLESHLRSIRGQLEQAGEGVLAVPEPENLERRLRAPWVESYLEGVFRANPDLLALRVLTPEGLGSSFGARGLALEEAMNDALRAGFDLPSPQPSYRLATLPGSREPAALVVVPVSGGTGEPRLWVDAAVRFPMLDRLFERGEQEGVSIFLIDRRGELLWSVGATPAVRQAVARSELLSDFARVPLAMTREYSLVVNGEVVALQAQVSPAVEAGWGVVVQKPASQAFPAVDKMILNTVLATLLLVLLALLVAVVAARKVSRPIQHLAETSHQIAAGRFGQRVEARSWVAEIAALGEDFNRMSEYVEGYVQDLQRAAQANRDLFIGSLRAFAAAIDAKDPYTRGHSERVAEYSRAICRQLGLPDEFRQRTWVAALLHDVGKIGIEDRVLQKVGLLTAEEFREIKRHPVIGAEIMSTIEQLGPMMGAIRWHHEAWNGTGYPDGLRGEEIPLMARIVAVADGFDAVTTDRPYQRGYTVERAVALLTDLAGQRYDAKVVTAFLRAYEAGEITVERRERRAEGDTIDVETAVSV